ncbi:Para-hydroxybenzoate--polyprenyltransferase, mitochondrial precursor (PHB:polyprenyltransferase) [Borealophlyctis nickersoniae]|nr:Para-hydroxybenzoate--polyprenyltransferase, mitochondrial precursor (PHB:polyprenyltransferase) [Borealophlyctis nickersoniae]
MSARTPTFRWLARSLQASNVVKCPPKTLLAHRCYSRPSEPAADSNPLTRPGFSSVLASNSSKDEPAASAPASPLQKYLNTYKQTLSVVKNGPKILWRETKEARALKKKIEMEGYVLNRNEYLLVKRNAEDVRRVIPFFFVILLLPEAIPFLLLKAPALLPSTLQSPEQSEKRWKKLQEIRLQLAKETVDRIRAKGGAPESFLSDDHVIQVAKDHPAQFYLEALGGAQVKMISKYLGLRSFGPAFSLRSPLKRHLEMVKGDDQLIANLGVKSLSLEELRAANETRGLSSVDLSEEQLQANLQAWLDLSLNKRADVPSGLLLVTSIVRMGLEGGMGNSSPPKADSRETTPTSTPSHSNISIASAAPLKSSTSTHSTPAIPTTAATPLQQSRALSTMRGAAVLPAPTWIDSMPLAVQPYLHLIRLDKPAGTYLLYLPCTWSIAMAAYASHGAITPAEAAWFLGLFGVGALVMRGAGCTINDMWDQEIDKKVERTRMRPLAAGTLTPFNALVFLGGQLSVGLMVLTQFNWYSIFLGASSLSVVVAYPLMKRVTWWPQAVLGLAFNWGAMLGWAALYGSVDWAVCLPLYLTGICWTLVYDTIYALQDKNDDIKVGVRSTALRFGENIKPWLSTFAAASVTSLAVAGIMNTQGPIFFAVAVGGAACHYAWQIVTLKVNDVKDAASKFKANAGLGLLVFFGVLGDWAWQRNMEDGKVDVE